MCVNNESRLFEKDKVHEIDIKYTITLNMFKKKLNYTIMNGSVWDRVLNPISLTPSTRFVGGWFTDEPHSSILDMWRSLKTSDHWSFDLNY